MEQFKKSISEKIHEVRPNLTSSSIHTYQSTLFNLYKNIFGMEYDLKNFNDVPKILDYLKEKPFNSRKSVLSALYIISGNPKYKIRMLDDISEYNQEVNLQTKNQKQIDADVPEEEMNKIFDHLKKSAGLIYKNGNITVDGQQQIQNYLMLCLLSGKYLPPRRSLDYACMKIRNVDKDKDNYIEKGWFIFNVYKTAKFYGQQKLKIPPALRPILNKWISVDTSDYLLHDSKNQPLNAITLNQRFEKIFGRKVGVNGLRHMYLSTKYQKTIELNDAMNQDLKDMGSSSAQSKVYVKRDD